MRIKSLFASILMLAFGFQLFAQEAVLTDRNKKVVILGSSVAAGWVTSYQEKYDMQNGYAYRLARQLEPQGWEVVNISIPGFDTKSTIGRFEEDVLPLGPGYVLIGLSMSNEGLETKDPDSVFNSYHSGMMELISLCRKNNIMPIVGLCYSNDNYTEKQYGYIKKMNLLINSLDVPCVNLLGVLDDGNGHFPEGYTFDPNHPDDRGHEEMFYAFVPDIFDALNAGKVLPPSDILNTKMLAMTKGSATHEICYIPADVMHSFTVFFHFSSSGDSKILSIQRTTGTNTLSIDEKGFLHYSGNHNEVSGEVKIKDQEYHSLAFTHQYLTKQTMIYLNGQVILKADEQLEPVLFRLGAKDMKTQFGQLLIYRGALNQGEIDMLLDGKLYQASLEVASLLSGSDLGPKDNILTNYALSMGNAVEDPVSIGEETGMLTHKIESARFARDHELKVEHRQAIEIDPSLLDQYTGAYEIEPDDNLLVVKEGDQLFLEDHGRKEVILPEGNDQFFIKYPADILVIFQKDEDGLVTGLIFSVNGREMPARKISD